MDLSVVFGTYNRRKHLLDCIESVRHSVGGLSYEIVVADAGSTDGGRELLATQPDVVLLGERSLDGAVVAFNKAFSLARGWSVCNCNDDNVFIGDCLEKAYRYLWAHQERVAQVAFAHDESFNGNFRRGDVISGKQCANFGLAQRLIGDYVGWWGETYHTYGGDTEVSMKYWELGYEVHFLPDCRVHHARVHDSLRRANDAAGRFYKIWTPERIKSFPRSPSVTREEMAKRKVVRLW